VRSKKQLMLIALMVIIFLSLCINYTYSQLSPTKRRELVTAYMNGYYRALQLDIEEIKKLQNDKGVLSHKVKTAGVKYADLIDIMNSPNPDNNKENREYRDHRVSEGKRKY
jgi:hypothetical protein